MIEYICLICNLFTIYFFFQAQNFRELGFKKGDLIYVNRQIDSNWYEGERNAMVGIFPTMYVEVFSESDVASIR